MKMFTFSRLRKLAAALLLAAGTFPASALEVTLYPDGTDSDEHVPVFTYYGDTAGNRTQTIYPADSLEQVIGKAITELTFYVEGTYTKDYTYPIKVSLAAIDADSFTESTFYEEGLVEVFNGSIQCAQGDSLLTIPFTDSFTYGGRNLLIDITYPAKASYAHVYFKGKAGGNSGDNAYYAANSSQKGKLSFFPTVTISAEDIQQYAAKLTTDNIAFKRTEIPATRKQSFTVRNNGMNPFTITATGLEGTPFSAEIPAGELASGATATIPVTFAPTEEGTFDATLTLDMGQAGTAEVALSGEALMPIDGVINLGEGEATTEYIPFYLYNNDTPGIGSQIIYPASLLTRAIGKQISSIAFHAAAPHKKNLITRATVSMGTSEADSFASTTAIPAADLREVFNGEIAFNTSTNDFVIELSTPYIYEGGNLVVSLATTAKGENYENISFLGEATENTAALSKSSSMGKYSAEQFLPYTTFTYNDALDYAYSITPEAVDFGKHRIGDSTVRTIKITNKGLNPFPVSATGLSGTPFAVELPAQQLASGASMEITVSFTPDENSQAGPVEASLLLNLGEAGKTDITLQGNVFVPVVVDGQTTVYEMLDDAIANLPINPLYFSQKGAGSQVIYPAGVLEHMQGQQLTGLRYYFAGEDGCPNTVSCGVTVKAGYAIQDTYTTSYATYLSGLTEIYNSDITINEGDTTMEIPVNIPFTYKGGNLVIELAVENVATTTANCSFLGEISDSNCAISRTSTYIYAQAHPRTTFLHREQPDYIAMMSPAEIDFGKTKAGMQRTAKVSLTNAGKLDFTASVSITGPGRAAFSTPTYEVEAPVDQTVEIPVVFAPTEGGNFTATLKVDCGEAGIFETSLSGYAPRVIDGEIEVADEDGQNANVPLSMAFVDTRNHGSQTIYLAEELVRAKGQGLTGVTYHLIEGVKYDKTYTPTMAVYIGATTEDRFTDSWAPIDGMTKVYEGEVEFAKDESTFSINFDTPYTYLDGNIVVALQIIEPAVGYMQGQTYYAGEETDNIRSLGTSSGAFSGSKTAQKFVPWTTFTYGSPQEFAAKVFEESVTFATVKEGQTTRQRIRVANIGINPFTITASGLEDTPFSIEVPDGELAVGATVELPVTFAPEAAGEFAASLTLDMGRAGTATVALSGQAVARDFVDGQTTVFDLPGSNGSTYIPICTYFFDTDGTTGQVIYPASELEHMIGQEITSIKYYVNNPAGASKSSTAGVSVKMAYVDNIEFTNEQFITDGLFEFATLPTFKIEKGDTEIELTATEPFVYTGGNLLVQLSLMQKISASDAVSILFKGEDATINCALTKYGTNQKYVPFYPMTTFYHEEVADDKASASETSLNFGTVLAGDELTKTIKLRNRGVNSFTPTLEVDGEGFYTTDLETELAAGESAEISVTFEPDAEGTYEATLLIDCGAAGIIEVALTGTSTGSLGDMTSITINNSTGTNTHVPFDKDVEIGSTGTTQIIYPATDISAAAGKYIYGLTFYTAADGFEAPYTSEIRIALATTTSKSFSSSELFSGLNEQEVYAGTFEAEAEQTELSFTFTKAYKYSGDNLLITLENTPTCEATLPAFLGTTPNTWQGGTANSCLSVIAPASQRAAGDAAATSANRITFYPKATIAYNDIYTGVEEIELSGIAVRAAGDCIAFSLGETTDANIAVYNMAGTLVEAIGNANGTLTTRALPAGCYLVAITAGDARYTLKVAL